MSASIIAGASTKGTLIHREPEGDFDAETEPWYSESHWLIEGGKITGIKLVCKCTQDKVLTRTLTRTPTPNPYNPQPQL